MKKIYFMTAAAGLFFSSPALTLDEALQRASGESPELRAARAEAQASIQDIRTASAWADPELEFEMEGLGGNRGGNKAEYTALFSQEFPVSGRIRQSRTAAAYAADAARAAGLEAGLDFERTVRLAFIDLQAAQEIRTVRSQQLSLAEEILDAVKKRNEAGAASELDVLHSGMLLESGRIEMQAAEKELAVARKKLSGWTGIPDIENVEGDFFLLPEIPEERLLCETHPVLQRFQALEKKAAAEVALAGSAGRPDITLGAGMRYEEAENAGSFIFSVSAPLPVFNRRRADVLSAGFRSEAVRFEKDRIRRELLLELNKTAAEFESAVQEVSVCRSLLLPKAERAVELSREGYASGRYGRLEYIAAQQMLADIRMRAVEAQRTALRAHAELLKFSAGDER